MLMKQYLPGIVGIGLIVSSIVVIDSNGNSHNGCDRSHGRLSTIATSEKKLFHIIILIFTCRGLLFFPGPQDNDSLLFLITPVIFHT